MLIPKLGPAVLELRDSAEPPMWAAWRLQAGMGAFGALGLLGLLFAYRRMRSRLSAVGAIREALAAVEAGQDTGAQLAISAALGKEAATWNRLLAEREKLRERATTERAAESLSNRRGRDGDLASACDAMWQGMLLVDDQMKVKYVNGAAAVFLQHKREEIAGQDATGLFEDAKLAAAVRSVATGAVRSRTVIEVDRSAEKNGGVLRFSVRPVRKEDAATALVLIEDITQQRVADASRNAFVAQATHELRTPLTNIRLYVDGLLEEPDQEPAKRAQSINVISQEARRLERIVGDMLSVAEIEAGQLKLRRGDVRLDAMFNELQLDFREQAEHKEIKLAFDLPPKLPVIGGDRDKIVLALHNLVGNAIKYTPAGGEVKVSVREEGPSLVVDVADNGIGIKAEECELIFDKFYRAKDKRIAGITGSGLGLALAREVARLHGGDITVHSQVDKGTTFSLLLPAAPPPMRAAA
jgi:signal transduction histidine kinase